MAGLPQKQTQTLCVCVCVLCAVDVEYYMLGNGKGDQDNGVLVSARHARLMRNGKYFELHLELVIISFVYGF